MSASRIGLFLALMVLGASAWGYRAGDSLPIAPQRYDGQDQYSSKAFSSVSGRDPAEGLYMRSTASEKSKKIRRPKRTSKHKYSKSRKRKRTSKRKPASKRHRRRSHKGRK